MKNGVAGVAFENDVEHILEKDYPYLIDEFGKGASNYYGTMSQKMWSLVRSFGYKIYLLRTGSTAYNHYLKRNLSTYIN